MCIRDSTSTDDGSRSGAPFHDVGRQIGHYLFWRFILRTRGTEAEHYVRFTNRKRLDTEDLPRLKEAGELNLGVFHAVRRVDDIPPVSYTHLFRPSR